MSWTRSKLVEVLASKRYMTASQITAGSGWPMTALVSDTHGKLWHGL